MAKSVEECHRVLDVALGASLEEVKQAYRVLVMVWHPDRLGQNAKVREIAEEKLKHINEAYDTLCHFLKEGSEHQLRAHEERERAERAKQEQAQKEHEQQERDRVERERKRREEAERREKDERRREQERWEREAIEKTERLRQEKIRKEHEDKKREKQEIRVCKECESILEFGSYRCVRCGCESSRRIVSSEELKEIERRQREREVLERRKREREEADRRQEAERQRRERQKREIEQRERNKEEIARGSLVRVCTECGTHIPLDDYQCPRCGCESSRRL